QIQPMGMNWDHSYNIRLVDEYEDSAGIRYFGFMPGNGRYDVFREDPDLAPSPGIMVLTADGYHGIIEYEPATDIARYVLPDGTVYAFAPFDVIDGDYFARLDRIRDRSGNEM